MIFMKILFVVLILVCAVFYIMYLWDFALVLLIAIISVPIIMFITTAITKNLIDVEFALKSNSAAKNESFPILLKVNNKSIFPIGKAEAQIEYFNMCSDDVSSFNLFMPIQARNSQSVSFQLKSKYCGMVNVRCAGITVYDPLRIFRFRIGRNINTEIAILPEGHEISGEVSYTDRVSEESNVFSEHKPGDDPSEVFDLRGYNPGDKLNRIHWKLSSKKDEFIVKDYSLPVDIPCTVFLDMKLPKLSRELILPVFDTLIESLVSLSQFLIENERIHNIVYYSSASGRFIEKTIDSIETLAAVIGELISSVRSSEGIQPAEDYVNELENLSLSSFTLITSRLNQGTTELIDEKIDADIKNIAAVVPSLEEASKLDALNTGLSIIPVVIGRITASVKDIEI